MPVCKEEVPEDWVVQEALKDDREETGSAQVVHSPWVACADTILRQLAEGVQLLVIS